MSEQQARSKTGLQRTTPCPVCGSEEAEVVWTTFRGDIDDLAVMCVECRLVRRDRPPDGFGDLNDFYRKDYATQYFDAQKKEIERLVEIFGPYQRVRLDRLSQHLPLNCRTLEIGCGPGYFLDAARARGAEVAGIELNLAHADFARRIYGIDVDTRPLEGDHLPAAEFDLVCMFQILEHVAFPLDFLAHARRLLKPGGVLAVEVPNIKNPLVSLYGVPAFRNFWFQRPHLLYFDATTLATTVTRAGFGQVRVHAFQEMGLVNHINWMVAGRPMSNRAAAQMQGIPWAAADSADAALVERLSAAFHALSDEYRAELEKAGYGDTLLGVFRRT